MMARKDPFERKVISPTVRAARRYKKRYGHSPNEAELRTLKIQTANPFLRGLLIVAGLPLLYYGYESFQDGDYWFSTFLILLSIVSITLGVRGRKKTLQALLDAYDPIDGLASVIDIISGI